MVEPTSRRDVQFHNSKWLKNFAANIWTLQARTMLDEAVGYIAQDSPAAGQRLLVAALDAAASDEAA